MRKIITINTSELNIGMILADDLRHTPTGTILLSAGTKVSPKALQAIKLFPVGEKCLIYENEEVISLDETTAETQGGHAENKTDGDKTGEKTAPVVKAEMAELPAAINQQTQKIFRETYETVKDFYKSAAFSDNIDLKEISGAAKKLTGELLHDPQVFLQISVLKVIDDYTFSHAVHVAIYATTLGKALHMSPNDLYELCLGGLLHDIGKIDIPPEIVNKPGKLTDEEYKIMKEHVRYSFNRVYRFQNINRALLSAIGEHHERMDGSGYLQNLKGTSIHKWARLMAVADVYDAVTSNRCYREAMLPHEGAEILMGSAFHLDPHLVRTFIRTISFYPVGCKVMLSTNEQGIVLGAHRDMPLRPIIHVTKRDGKGSRVINLANDLTTFITHIIKE